jgi:S1-C subfamily serine protease
MNASRHTPLRRRTAPFALAILLALPLAAQPAGAGVDLARILAERAPAVVSVQVVVQVKMGGEMGSSLGEKQEFQTEASCVVIDPKGLVLCSNTLLGGYMSLIQRVMGGKMEMTATPTQIKVLVADEPKPLEAKLLVRDSDLDLAWLQVKAPEGKTFAYVDLGRSATPKVGDPFVAVRRLDKFFDRTPTVYEGKIGGTIKKPRTLYVPTATAESSLGLPALSPSGEVLGILVLQFPDSGSDLSDGSGPFGRLEASARVQELVRGFILPAADVVKATKRALDSGKSGK